MGELVCIEPAWKVLNQNEEKESAKTNNKLSILKKKESVDLPKSGVNQRFLIEFTKFLSFNSV
jgi:hypothetical protein